MIIILIKKKVIKVFYFGVLKENIVCVKSFSRNFNYKNFFLIAKIKK